MRIGVQTKGLVAVLLLLPPLLLAASPPTAVSVTPNSGSGNTQTFSFLYSDADGANKITYIQALINGSFSWQNACAVLYVQSSNRLYLVQDSGTGWQGPLTPGQAGTLSNSQCTLNGGASSVSAVGNNLTVNAALTFKPAFGGSKTVFLDGEDTPNHLSSGWQSRGSWTVPASAPMAVSVTPNSGSDTSQTFSFLFSDSSGANKITYIQALINGSLAWPNSCAVLYYQSTNRLYLALDSGAGWQGPLTPGQAGTLSNSQCTLNAAASSVSAVGNNLTVNAALTFKSAFGGNKTVYLDAEDTPNKLSSGWQSRGTWTVPVSAPTAVSVTPSSGTGSSQTFAFLFSDASGANKITYIQGLINHSLAWQNSCGVLYYQSTNRLYLVQDSGAGWQGPLTPGQAGTLQNSQCTLDGGTSSVSAVGNNLTVNAALTFKPAFAGNKTVYLDAEDTPNHLSSGWQNRGSWAAPNPAPSLSSISPTSILATSGNTLLTATGSSFLAQSVVEFGGLDLTTTFQSSTQLTATIPASMLQDPGTIPITVRTPGPGGGVSGARDLTIASAVSVSPDAETVPVNWTRQFTATVSGEANQSVTWMVNDVPGGSASTGTITASGIYLAPGSVPGNNQVTVKAVSVANPSKYGTAGVTITLPASDNYPRSDGTSILDSQPALAQVPLQGTIAAVLDWTSRDTSAAGEEVLPDAEVLAVCHNLSELGIPHIHTTDWNTAKTYPMVAVAGVLETDAVNDTERDALASYVQAGGTLLLWRTGDAGLLSRLGVTASTTLQGSTTRQVTFDAQSGDGVVRYIDDAVEVNWPMQYWLQGLTREYTVGSATALAGWTDGLAAIARSNLGTGRAYVFGWRLKIVLVDSELQAIPGVEGAWTNTQVLDADLARLMVRGIYETLPGSPHVRQFAPNGKPAALILTHDVDAKVSYDNLPQYLALENTQGVKATYLFTTAPYDSGWVEEMYNASGKANIQNALNQGFDIQSHSFAHFIDFDKAPFGTGNGTANDYLPHYSADLGHTVGSSALGELGVSRWLLQKDFNIQVTAFRSGYLLMPQNFLSAVQDTGYRRESTYAAGISRGFTPFVPFTLKNGVITTYPFMEYPMGLEDPVNLSADNVTQTVDTWERVIRTNYKNNVPTVINVHPVNQPRLDALQLLFQRISDLDLWIGDWKTFDDFWQAQGVTCDRWP